LRGAPARGARRGRRGAERRPARDRRRRLVHPAPRHGDQLRNPRPGRHQRASHPRRPHPKVRRVIGATMQPPEREAGDASPRPACSRVADRSTDGAASVLPGAGTDTAGTRVIVTEIVERASTLWERLASAAQTEPGDRRGDLDKSIDAWRATAAKGDAEAFTRRLARDGLDVAAAERATGPIRITTGVPLPEWAVVLERYIAVLGDSEA